MIEWFMFGSLGFFLGCLLGLMLAPPLWNRAVKLTTRRLEATMPMTLADIQADKDQIRADFAIQLRKVEVALDKSKEKAARELIEANKRRVEIQRLNGSLDASKGELSEAENANRVLQQTIKRRLPDLDARLKAAKKALTDLETVNAELRSTVASQAEALKVARATVHNQRADIDQLRLSLESGNAAGRGSAKGDARAVAESQRLTAELSRAQEELTRAQTSAEEIAFLRRELGHLASQILDAARAQPPSWQAAAGAVSGAAAAQSPEYDEDDEAVADTEPMPQYEMPAEEPSPVMQPPGSYAGNGADQPEAEHAVAAYDAPQHEDDTHEDAPYQGEDGYQAQGAHLQEEAYQAQEAYQPETQYEAETPYQAQENYQEEPYQAEETAEAEVEYTSSEAYQPKEAHEAEATFEPEQPHETHEPHEPEQPQPVEPAYAAPQPFVIDDNYELDEDYETYEIEGDYRPHAQDAQEEELQAHGGEHLEEDERVHHASDYEEEGEEDEPVAQPRSLSQRLAGGSAKEQPDKQGGGSLTSRLRGLVAD